MPKYYIDDIDGAEYYEGLQLTRFLYIRDEVIASYLCDNGLKINNDKYKNNHQYWISELIESGFHEDANYCIIHSFIQNILLYKIPKSRLISLYIGFIHLINERNEITSFYDLNQIHNDMECDMADKYRFDTHELSNFVNQIKKYCISTSKSDTKHNIQTNQSFLNQSNHDELDIGAGFDESNMIDTREIDEINNFDDVTEKELEIFSEIVDLSETFNSNKFIIKKIPKKREWYSKYDDKIYLLLSNIEKLHKSNTKYINQKQLIGLYKYCISYYNWTIKNEIEKDHNDEDFSFVNHKREIVETYVSNIINIIADFGLNILFIEKVYNPISLALLNFVDEDNQSIQYWSTLDIDNFHRLMIDIIFMTALAYIFDIPENQDLYLTQLKNDEEFIDSYKKLDYNTDFMNIQGLRKHQYFDNVSDLIYESVPFKKMLENKPIIPISKYIDICNFTIYRNMYSLEIAVLLHIREYEWMNYAVFTPLWYERFRSSCKCNCCKMNNIPFDFDSMSFELENCKCEGLCFDKWDMDFVECTRETKENIIGMKY